MKKVSKRLRLASLFLLSSTLVIPATPASHAASSFGACSKSGSKLRISGSVHTCGKNPVKKSKALVWLPKICIDTNKEYLTKLNQVTEAETNSAEALNKIEQAIVAWRAQVPAFEQAAKDKEAIALEAKTKAANARKRAADALAKAKAAGETTVAGKQLLQSAENWEGNAKAYDRAERIALEEATKLRQSVNKEVAELESSKGKIASDIKSAKDDLKLLNANRKLLCTKI